MSRWRDWAATQTRRVHDAGRWRAPRDLDAAGPTGTLAPDGTPVVSFASNDYLGLTRHPAVIAAAHAALDRWGSGAGSARLIVGSRPVHSELERALADWRRTEAAVLFPTGFAANLGVLTTFGGPDVLVCSDALNHASIIDGIRLCKAERHRYPNGDLEALEKALQATQNKRLRLVATDGVFSMDGYLAKLDKVCDLAEKYDAMVMVDDSHATGFVGATGRGTAEHCGVMDRVDIVTGTFGKALGGASGGFTASRREVVSLLRQRSRPYLFSNTVAPSIVGAAIAALDLLTASTALRDKVMANALRFREGMQKAGFTIKPGIHPIVPVMLGDARLAGDMAAALLERGIYVIGFSFPVVPKGEARIRVQLSAQHTDEDIDRAVAAFTEVGRSLGVVR